MAPQEAGADVRKDAQPMTLLDRQALLGVACVVGGLLAGCAQPTPPSPRAPYPLPRSVVVAPLLNQSPSADFDVLAATDTLVAELAQFEGLTVLPTHRALTVLSATGRSSVRSVEEALDLAGVLGVDGVLVGAVTEYDPYQPMKIGMTLQLYWVRADIQDTSPDPAAMARQAAPESASPAYYAGAGPSGQASGIFDASRNDTVRRVQQFAASHQGLDSPFGWRRYLVDREAYLQFVCHELIVALMEQELDRITTVVPAP